MPSLAAIAAENGFEVLDVLRAAKSRGLGSVVEPEQAELLARVVSEAYELSLPETLQIEDFLLFHPHAQDVFRQYVGLESLLSKDDSERVLNSMVRRLADQLNPVLKKKINPHRILQVIMNLGVIPVYRRGSSRNNIDEFVGECLGRYSPEMAARLLARYHMRRVQTKPVDIACGEIQSLVSSIPRDSKSYFFAASRKLNDLSNFCEATVSRALASPVPDQKVPLMHQLIRMYETLGEFDMPYDGSPRKGVVIGDGTSAGKTFTAVGFKAIRDAKHGKKSKALVVAPNAVLRDAWKESRIINYCESLGIDPVIAAQTSRLLDREEWPDLRKTLEADFILVNYEKLARETPESNAYCRFILDNIHSIDMLVIDEAHHLRNVYSKTSNAFKEIIRKGLSIPKIIMSASLVPNKLQDLGFLLWLSDPVRYERYSSQKFDYRKDPHAIQNAIATGSWFSITREEVQQIHNLPELSFLGDDYEISIGRRFRELSRVHPVAISDELCERYLNAWESELPIGEKMKVLRQTLLMAKVAPVSEKVFQLLRDEPDSQISIFTTWKEHFVNPLAEILSAAGIPIGIITGDEDDVDKRLSIARRFSEGEYRVNIQTSQTAGEGISITTGGRPCHLLIAEPTEAPGVYHQILGRHLRIGQSAPVYVHEFIAMSAVLNQEMIRRFPQLVAAGASSRASWRPGTLDEDRLRMRVAKEIMFREYVQRGLELTELFERLSEMDEEDPASGLLSLPKKRRPQPNLSFNEHLKNSRGAIGGGIEHYLDEDENNFASSVRQAYCNDHWEQTSSADTARIVSRIISTIEQTSHSQFARFLDWGCGPACIERILERPVTNMDADMYMLEEGKKRVEGKSYAQEPAHAFIRGNMRNTAFRDKSFQVITSNYAMQYNAQGDRDRRAPHPTATRRRDIEEIFSETNRILEIGGYTILGLPNQTTEQKDLDHLTGTFLPAYGFDVLFCDLVKGYSEGVKMFDGSYIIIARKVHDVQGLAVEIPQDIVVYGPKKLKVAGGHNDKDLEPCSRSENSREKRPSTEFRDSNGRDIESVIYQTVGAQ